MNTPAASKCSVVPQAAAAASVAANQQQPNPKTSPCCGCEVLPDVQGEWHLAQAIYVLLVANQASNN